jgi:hypothetical protein
MNDCCFPAVGTNILSLSSTYGPFSELSVPVTLYPSTALLALLLTALLAYPLDSCRSGGSKPDFPHRNEMTNRSTVPYWTKEETLRATLRFGYRKAARIIDITGKNITEVILLK